MNVIFKNIRYEERDTHREKGKGMFGRSNLYTLRMQETALQTCRANGRNAHLDTSQIHLEYEIIRSLGSWLCFSFHHIVHFLLHKDLYPATLHGRELVSNMIC